MRKIALIVLGSLLGHISLQAQPEEAALVDQYGAIRAEMVKEACRIVGVNDTALLNLIKNNSIQSFKLKVKNDTLKNILKDVKALSGKDISVYDSNMRETRRLLVTKLGQYYPKREEAINKQFLPYIQKIDDVTNRLNSKPEANKAIKDKPKKNKVTKNTVKKESEPDQKSGGSYSFLKWCLLALIAYLLYYFYKKKKKHSEPTPIEVEEVQQQASIESAALPVETIKENTESITTDTNEDEKEEADQTIVNEEGQAGQPIEEGKEHEEIPTAEGKCMAQDAGDWIVVGASVQGNGHIKMNMPCQDNHGYEYLEDGWGIAITSDGAGSAKQSHVGSAAVVSRAMLHFKELIEQNGWKKNQELPSDVEWMKCSYQILKRVHDEVAALALHNSCEPKDFNATIIVVIHSPYGLLVAHVGDGRAGYQDMNGNWNKLITPHKGEEANQTIFMESAFWNKQFFEMSGVMVPESLVLREPVSAFVLMSDGCESTSWLCNQFNEETGKYHDPNMPYAKFFDSLSATLHSFREDEIPLEERRMKWYKFIKEGNKSFVKETDDKTMLLAVLHQSAEQ